MLVFIDLGRAIYYYSALNNAIREGARQATVSRYTNASLRQTKIRETVLAYAISVPLAANDISVYCDQNPSNLDNPCTNYVTVAAQVRFAPVTFFLAQIVGSGNMLSLNAESTMQMTPYGKYE